MKLNTTKKNYLYNMLCFTNQYYSVKSFIFVLCFDVAKTNVENCNESINPYNYIPYLVYAKKKINHISLCNM